MTSLFKIGNSESFGNTVSDINKNDVIIFLWKFQEDLSYLPLISKILHCHGPFFRHYINV